MMETNLERDIEEAHRGEMYPGFSISIRELLREAGGSPGLERAGGSLWRFDTHW